MQGNHKAAKRGVTSGLQISSFKWVSRTELKLVELAMTSVCVLARNWLEGLIRSGDQAPTVSQW